MGPIELFFHNPILVEYDDVILLRSGNVRRTLCVNMFSANLIITSRERLGERSLFGGMLNSWRTSRIVSHLIMWLFRCLPYMRWCHMSGMASQIISNSIVSFSSLFMLTPRKPSSKLHTTGHVWEPPRAMDYLQSVFQEFIVCSYFTENHNTENYFRHQF